jgi:hypothetical protein
VPCVSTALLIYANSRTKTWAGRILETQPVVFVGLISYSLYLWHWPLLSFLAYLRCGASLDNLSSGVALVLSAVLAVISWKYVETPFRRKDMFPEANRLLIAAVAAVSMVITVSFAIVMRHGLPERISPQAIAYASTKQRDSRAWPPQNVTIEEIKTGRLPRFGAETGDITCLVWGDSHARRLIPGIDAACKTHGVRGFDATHPGTAPILDFFSITPHGLNDRAPAFNRAVVDFALARHIDIVFVSCIWSRHARTPLFESCLRKTIRECADAGINVVIVRDVAAFTNHADPTMQLALAVQLGSDVSSFGVPLTDYLKKNERPNKILDSLVADNVSVFDPSPAFVDDTGLWRAEHGGDSMYSDDHHLSVAGSLRLQPLFEALLDRLLPPAEQSEYAP